MNDYETKKQVLESIKTLSKEEYQELFRILKRNNIEYTENSNGIFFDLTPLDADTFQKIVTFLDFCKEQRKSEEVRSNEMNMLRQETVKET